MTSGTWQMNKKAGANHKPRVRMLREKRIAMNRKIRSL